MPQNDDFANVLQPFINKAQDIGGQLNSATVIKITPIWYVYEMMGRIFNIYGADDGYWYLETLIITYKYPSKQALFDDIGQQR